MADAEAGHTKDWTKLIWLVSKDTVDLCAISMQRLFVILLCTPNTFTTLTVITRIMYPDYFTKTINPCEFFFATSGLLGVLQPCSPPYPFPVSHVKVEIDAIGAVEIETSGSDYLG